jgi:RimJ/RimL family protein N-acetyltransferase
MTKAGSLVCVGVGMTLGSHLTPLSRSYIEQADVVLTGLSDGIIEMWLAKMNADVRSLQSFYREGKSRRETYRQMVDAMLTEVRAGKKVCGAFYGHPGVFAWPPHKAIEVARKEGFQAHMEAGVSAEDCLYADLGIDPGTVGCQHYEASQIMLYRRKLDPSAYLILWQVGVAGDRSFARFSTGVAYRQVLVDILARDYDLDHEVILYRGATLPVHQPRIERLKLRDLPNAEVDMHMTMVVPPAQAMEPDAEIRERLAALDRTAANESRGTNEVRVFDTKRLRLRGLGEEDEKLYCDLYTDAQTMKFIGEPLSPQRVLRAFRKAVQLTRQKDFRQRIFVVTEKATDCDIGVCGFGLADAPDRVEAGVILAASARAQGYGHEALVAMIRMAFTVPQVQEVVVMVNSRNPVTDRLVRRVGFSCRGSVVAADRPMMDRLWVVSRNSWFRGSTAKESNRGRQSINLFEQASIA